MDAEPLHAVKMIWQTCLLIALLVFAGTGNVNAQWNWREAEAQSLRLTEDALVAVGEEIFQSLPIGWGELEALDEGILSAALRKTIEKKGFPLADRVTIRVLAAGWKWLIIDNIGKNKKIFALVHDKGAPHSYTDMYKLESVPVSRILTALRRGKEIRLKHAIIEERVNLANRGELPSVYFINTCFSRRARFGKLTFSAAADFTTAHFSEGSDFRDINFMGEAQFHGASFARNAHFHKIVFRNTADFSAAIFLQDARYMKVQFSKKTSFQRTAFGGRVWFVGTFADLDEGVVDFTYASFANQVSFTNMTFPGITDFNQARFADMARADFKAATFSGVAGFRASEFSGGVIFERARFKGKADFVDAKLAKSAEFGNTQFLDEAAFSYADFSGDVVFTSAFFAADVRFAFVTFTSDTREVSFQGARFARKADFSYSTLVRGDFNSYVPRNERLFEIDYVHGKTLGEKIISKKLKDVFLAQGGIELSSEINVVIIEEGSKWLVMDKANRNSYAIVRGKSSPEKEKDSKRLTVYLVERDSFVQTLNLVGCDYQYMNIRPRDIKEYHFDENAFNRFLKNLKDIGSQPYEYESVVLELKRFQRDQKGFVNRWFEMVFFDWPTRYGTARIPWGLFLYVVVCVISFTLLYLLNRGAFIFVKADGSVDNDRQRPNILEIFWFSLNSFTPAIEFFNATNWRLRYDAKLPFGLVRYTTMATFERILGWAMVPSLLSYLKPEAYL